MKKSKSIFALSVVLTLSIFTMGMPTCFGQYYQKSKVNDELIIEDGRCSEWSFLFKKITVENNDFTVDKEDTTKTKIVVGKKFKKKILNFLPKSTNVEDIKIKQYSLYNDFLDSVVLQQMNKNQKLPKIEDVIPIVFALTLRHAQGFNTLLDDDMDVNRFYGVGDNGKTYAFDAWYRFEKWNFCKTEVTKNSFIVNGGNVYFPELAVK